MNPSTIALAAGIQVRDAARWVPWPAAIIALGYATVAVVLASTGVQEGSVWASVGWTLEWLAFAAGIGTGAYLPALVAHGLSRRTATAASLAGMLGLAVAMAAYVQIGYAVEWLAYGAADLPYTLDGQHLFGEARQVHLVLAEYALLFAGFLASGWLVWAGYYRYGARATFALPLALMPGVGAQAVLAAGWAGGLAVPAALALTLAVVAAGAAAIAALTRAIPVKTS
jgi:hypothetical protein